MCICIEINDHQLLPHNYTENEHEKWIIAQNVKAKSIKCVERNIGKKSP